MDITNVLRSHGIGVGKKKAYTQQLSEVTENQWSYLPTVGSTYINTLLTQEGNVVTVTRDFGVKSFVDCVSGKTGLRMWLVEIPPPYNIYAINIGLDGYLYAVCRGNTASSNLQVTKIDAITGANAVIELPNTGQYEPSSIAADLSGAIFLQSGMTYYQLSKFTVSGITATKRWHHTSDVVTSNSIRLFMLLPDISAVLFMPGNQMTAIDVNTGTVINANLRPQYILYAGLKAPGLGDFYAIDDKGISLFNITRGATPQVTRKISRIANFGGVFDFITPYGAMNLVNNGEFLYAARGDYGIKLNPSTLDILSVFYCPNAKLVNSQAEFFARETKSIAETKKYKYYSKIR